MHRVRHAEGAESEEHELEDADMYKDYIEKAEANNNYKYLEDRGISEEIQRRFRVGFDPEWKNPVTVKRWEQEGKDVSRIPKSPRCIIPTGNGGYLARDTRKNLTPGQKRYAKQFAGHKGLFNYEALSRKGAVFVVEGEIDAMSIAEAGFCAVGLCGAANVRRFLNAAARAPAGMKVVLMLDPDEAGRRSSEAIIQGLKELKIESMDATERFRLQGDPNELLMKDRIDFSYFLSQMDEMMRKSGATKPPIANRIAEIERTAEYSSQPGREYVR